MAATEWPAIRCVIFDMDEVLCHYDFPLRLRIMADALDVTPELIETTIYASGFDQAADEGDIGADDYLPEMSRRLDREVPLDLWLEARRRSMQPNLPMLDLARALRRSHTIAMLTNNNLLLKRHIADVFPAAVELFGAHAYFSAQFGTGKDAPDVFGHVLARLGHAPGETLFIDDTAAYIANATTAGLHTHCFRDVPALLAAFARLGLPTA